MASERDAVTAMRLLLSQRMTETRVGMACNYGTTATAPEDVAMTAEHYAESLRGHAQRLRAAQAALELLVASE